MHFLNHTKLFSVKLACLTLFYFVLASEGLGQKQQTDTLNEVQQSVEQNSDQRQQELKTQLIEFTGIISLQHKILKDLRAKLDQNPTQLTKIALEGQVAESEKILKNAEVAFESIVTGGLDLENFKEVPDQSFDWQSDLIEIIQPIFQSLKDLTEQPRAIERIRKTIEFYQQNLSEVENSILKIEEWSQAEVDRATRGQIQTIQEDWRKRKAEAQRNLELFQLQLRNLQIRQESIWTSVWSAFGAFLTGRGLNLMLAVLATMAVWFGMRTFLRFMVPKEGVDEFQTRSQYSRVLFYTYRILMMMASTAVFLIVLYVTGDWLLLGLALLILAGIAIGLKKYLPQFLAEAKLLLNLGAVREGEMVTYEGVPWIVKSINIYSHLVNPVLEGGELRMPLGEMSQLISQPIAEDEPWFPSNLHDYILLPDGSFGQVVIQTPEFVQIKSREMIRTFLVSDYLNLGIKNLSMGAFACVGNFGISLEHQEICLDLVPNAFERSVGLFIDQNGLQPFLEELSVELSSIQSGSIQYFLYVRMKSPAAKYYWKILRIMQQACVATCNSERWKVKNPDITFQVPPPDFPQK
ncbi:MAG: hypothetical protein EVA80_08635 [Proteobacteria bacterium]|nr:MAG: hypothetical protein EVA80_08635 [Pseudomonadota bacterium]|tara:strand:+ start:2720 stop:4456 length:1737 start_codon:yes stop_codon:yes gene_type:complete